MSSLPTEFIVNLDGYIHDCTVARLHGIVKLGPDAGEDALDVLLLQQVFDARLVIEILKRGNEVFEVSVDYWRER